MDYQFELNAFEWYNIKDSLHSRIKSSIIYACCFCSLTEVEPEDDAMYTLTTMFGSLVYAMD